MSTDRANKGKPEEAGRKYGSVAELMAGEGVAQEVQSIVARLAREVLLVEQLVELRKRAGLTQEDLAVKLGKSQSAISKLESSHDRELTVGEIAEYSKATGQRVSILFGKPMNHVEAVKAHAFGIKEHLSGLAELAYKDEDMDQAIQAFFGEAFFNLLNILAKCRTEMPDGGRDFEIRLKTIGTVERPPRLKPLGPVDA